MVLHSQEINLLKLELLMTKDQWLHADTYGHPLFMAKYHRANEGYRTAILWSRKQAFLFTSQNASCFHREPYHGEGNDELVFCSKKRQQSCPSGYFCKRAVNSRHHVCCSPIAFCPSRYVPLIDPETNQAKRLSFTYKVLLKFQWSLCDDQHRIMA